MKGPAKRRRGAGEVEGRESFETDNVLSVGSADWRTESDGCAPAWRCMAGTLGSWVSNSKSQPHISMDVRWGARCIGGFEVVPKNSFD